MFENTVAICDTEPIAIEGLRSLLGGSGTLRVVAAEHDMTAGLDAARDLEVAVLVMDKAFGMPSVLDAVRELKSLDTETRIVVWGSGISDGEALRLLHAGVAGVVRKTASLETLLDCLTTVAAGGNWMEDGFVRTDGPSVRPRRTPLSARELEVADLVERGMTNRDIARELGIRIGTVKIHVKHIFEKTGVRGRYGLALSGLKEKGILLAQALM